MKQFKVLALTHELSVDVLGRLLSDPERISLAKISRSEAGFNGVLFLEASVDGQTRLLALKPVIQHPDIEFFCVKVLAGSFYVPLRVVVDFRQESVVRTKVSNVLDLEKELLDESEVDDVEMLCSENNSTSAGITHALVMDYVFGSNLEENPAFSENLYVDLGRSFAYDLLLNNEDRFRITDVLMGFPIGKPNLGNVFFSGESSNGDPAKLAMIDIRSSNFALSSSLSAGYPQNLKNLTIKNKAIIAYHHYCENLSFLIKGLKLLHSKAEPKNEAETKAWELAMKLVDDAVMKYLPTMKSESKTSVKFIETRKQIINGMLMGFKNIGENGHSEIVEATRQYQVQFLGQDTKQSVELNSLSSIVTQSDGDETIFTMYNLLFGIDEATLEACVKACSFDLPFARTGILAVIAHELDC